MRSKAFVMVVILAAPCLAVLIAVGARQASAEQSQAAAVERQTQAPAGPAGRAPDTSAAERQTVAKKARIPPQAKALLASKQQPPLARWTGAFIAPQ